MTGTSVQRGPRFSWWYPLGVLAIIGAVLLLVDILIGARFYLFATGTLAVALIIGLFYLLFYAAVEGFRKLMVLVVGIVLVATSVAGIPLMIAQGWGSLTSHRAERMYTLNDTGGVETLDLMVENSVGHITVRAVDSPAFVVRAWVNVTGWGNLDETLDDIEWVTDVTGNGSEATLTLPSGPVVFFAGGFSFDADLLVNSDVLLNATLRDGTGSVTADFEGGRIGVLDLRTSTGSIDLRVDQAELFSFSSFTLETSTGGIDVSIELQSGPEGTIPISAQTSTGGVYLSLNLGATVGAYGEATTSIGGVDIASPKYDRFGSSFETPNRDVATTLFEVTLTTSTGGIDVV